MKREKNPIGAENDIIPDRQGDSPDADLGQRCCSKENVHSEGLGRLLTCRSGGSKERGSMVSTVFEGRRAWDIYVVG